VTWLDPKSGIEVSGSAGLTLNLDNPANDYQTGTEGHLEFALMRHIGKDFSFGVAGYHYQQVTGDSAQAPGSVISRGAYPRSGRC
jgi:hypothetical protein